MQYNALSLTNYVCCLWLFLVEAEDSEPGKFELVYSEDDSDDDTKVTEKPVPPPRDQVCILQCYASSF